MIGLFQPSVFQVYVFQLVAPDIPAPYSPYDDPLELIYRWDGQDKVELRRKR